MSVSSLPAPATAETVPVTVDVPPPLAAKLADPGVAESLTSLLSHADLVALLLEGVDGLLGRSEEIEGSLLDGIGELRETVDLSALTGGLDVGAVAKSLTSLAGSTPQLAEIAQPEALAQLGLISRGLTAGAATYSRSPVEITSIFTLAKLLKDPDIRRTLSYAATVAQAIGRELNK